MSKRKDEDDSVSLEENEELGGEDENDDEDALEVFSCKYCNFQTDSIDDLDEHIISHDEAILEDNYGEECEEIEEVREAISDSPKFTVSPFSKSDLKPMQRLKQSVPAFYDEFKNKLNKRVFVCPYCGYQSMKKLDMNRHIKVHSEPVEVPVYACAECSYTTRRKCDMPKHLLTHCKDGSVTMFKCSFCPYATKRKGDLTKHMVCHTKPDAQDVYRCYQCTYSTKRRGDLKKHMLSHDSHHNVKEGSQYNCTECGYTSKRLNDLHKHVVLHCDKTVQGILKCPKCEYATEVSSHFAKHVLSNCQKSDMNVTIFPKDPDTMQDFIMLSEDDLHLYQIDKDSLTPVELLDKDGQVLRDNRKRKRSKDDDSESQDQSDLGSYYVEDNQGLEESDLMEEVTVTDKNGKRVLVLSGYEEGEKPESEEL